VQNAIKEMRNKKDDVREDVLKLLGKDGLTLTFQLISKIYQNGEWPRDFTEVTMIALKKTPKATNYNSRCTTNLTAHTAKIVMTLYILLTVHPRTILQKSPTRCTFLLNIFISLLYMFRTSMCPSSGENYCITATLEFVTLYG